MPEPRSLAEIVQAATRAALDRVHTSVPGIVMAYYPDTQTADVQPVNSQAIFNAAGEKSYEERPVIPNVKVQFPRVKDWYMSFPIDVGDSVLLVFSESNIGEWRENGGTDNEPADTRRFSMSSPIAIPGVFPDDDTLDDSVPSEVTARAAGIVLGKGGTDAQIRFKPAVTTPIPAPAEIKIGGSASDFVALAALVQTALDAIQTKFDGHTHSVTGTSATGGAVTGTAAVTGTLVGQTGPVKAAITKAQ